MELGLFSLSALVPEAFGFILFLHYGVKFTEGFMLKVQVLYKYSDLVLHTYVI